MIPKKKDKLDKLVETIRLENGYKSKDYVNGYNQCHDEFSKAIIERLRKIKNDFPCTRIIKEELNKIIHDIEKAGKE